MIEINSDELSALSISDLCGMHSHIQSEKSYFYNRHGVDTTEQILKILFDAIEKRKENLFTV